MLLTYIHGLWRSLLKLPLLVVSLMNEVGLVANTHYGTIHIDSSTMTLRLLNWRQLFLMGLSCKK